MASGELNEDNIQMTHQRHFDAPQLIIILLQYYKLLHMHHYWHQQRLLERTLWTILKPQLSIGTIFVMEVYIVRAHPIFTSRLTYLGSLHQWQQRGRFLYLGYVQVSKNNFGDGPLQTLVSFPRKLAMDKSNQNHMPLIDVAHH